MNRTVSIIMGIYNCEDTLGKTIDSIISQTYKNWELVMCDDGSVDKTFDIAKEYVKKDSRIKLIRNSSNMGLAKTLNNCIEISTGDYVLRHDGDDIMLVNRIETQVNYMEANNCDACGSGAYIFDDSGIWGHRQPPAIPSKERMVIKSPFIHPTVIMKKDILIKVGGYSDNELTRQRLEDYDLWIKLFEHKFILHNIQEPLIYFREDRNSYNRRKKRYRINETKARFEACKRLEIPYLKRVFALKPLIAMLIPNNILKFYHNKKSSITFKQEEGNIHG
ncbi:glycosyltransferase EpsE [Lysinibacillus composti]|uniref:Glycosyltransferase family 2 protein n=1 Tax=Lysinibacillus composti TaxID=720633 RepID=A0A3N9UBQ8_9BACI|nr:glycosyltransferase family 2 protein [Lysinibacillus composti]MBM7610251.1 glycosyltransferase EpsE [Lysinibacillus composti]RQW73828.1 glycosyltransferase family 2 protein [Lysinibacillus composti]